MLKTGSALVSDVRALAATSISASSSMRRLFAITLLAGLCMLLAANAQASRGVPPLVSADWLANQLESEDLVVLDVRLADDFVMGHVAGAVNIPYPAFFVEGFMMPGINELARLFGNAGIDGGRRVVVYDDGNFIWAARAYWLLETLGLEQVGMLDVGFGNWATGLIPESEGEASPVARRFVPTVNHHRLSTRLDTLMSIDNPKRIIMDGRSRPEYLGKESQAERYGHIPGAVHYSWSNNFNDRGNGNKMLALDELEPVYAELDRDKQIVIYCNGGAQSAVNYIVLQALGYSVSVYDGSWFEWGNDASLPIFNPSKGD